MQNLRKHFPAGGPGKPHKEASRYRAKCLVSSQNRLGRERDQLGSGRGGAESAPRASLGAADALARAEPPPPPVGSPDPPSSGHSGCWAVVPSPVLLRGSLQAGV